MRQKRSFSPLISIFSPSKTPGKEPYGSIGSFNTQVPPSSWISRPLDRKPSSSFTFWTYSSLGPLVVTRQGFPAILQGLFDLEPTDLLNLIHTVHTVEFHQRLKIDASIPEPWILDLVISAEHPILWMSHNSGAYHVQIDVDQALFEMMA